MTREHFQQFAAQGYNRVPLAFETIADFDTPLSIYLKLADAPNSYLLESVQGGEKWGRYSIIGLPARTVLRVQGLQQLWQGATGQHCGDLCAVRIQDWHTVLKQALRPFVAPVFTRAIAHKPTDAVGDARCAADQHPMGLAAMGGLHGCLQQQLGVIGVVHVHDDGFHGVFPW